MVEGIIDAPFKPVNIDPVFSPSDHRSGESGHAIIMPAIINETVHLLGADGAGYICNNGNRDKLRLEYGSAGWIRWTGGWLNHQGTSLGMVSSTGQFELKNGAYVIFPSGNTDHHPDTQHLAYTPLLVNNTNLGSLWLGRQRKLTNEELLLLKSMGDVLASAIYTLTPATQSEAHSLAAIQALIEVLSAWDIRTYQHSLRLFSSVRATARRMGCSEIDAQTIGWAALLHDIGKLGVPKAILHKPGPLDEEEWAIIKKHPGFGARILEPVEKLRQVSDIILAHHEKYDGSGYPNGTDGTSIPLGARIIAVVDAYCAMTEEHTYRRMRTHEEAIQEIRACTGTHFDPSVSDAFLSQFA